MKGTAEKKQKAKISPQELQKMWQKIDLTLFWGKVVENVSKEAEAYERVRALSRIQASTVVFV